ncbi:hypothetical protein O3P69_001973 [Scylla paramamosain]|uniref:Neural-cadherin n=1 Tax=Scylla paramamosain TaxID=85552 RepID=A0AAW0V0U6_SCYPA
MASLSLPNIEELVKEKVEEGIKDITVDVKATRLVSGPGASSLEFSEPRYCAALPEDTPQAATVLTVAATHAKGAEVRYSITGGNKDGLFTIDQRTGTVTLAAALDFEINNKHDLVVAAEGGGETTYAKVRVRVNDVNDNAPYFIDPQPEVVVVEEDDRHLPATIATVSAQDSDWLDHHGLLYTVRGDGVDGLDPADAFFTINSLTGDLIQLRPLDRDPPRGKPVWRVRVQVRDGQALWSRQAMHRHLASLPKRGNAVMTSRGAERTHGRKKSQIAHAAISGERCQHAHYTETFKLRGIVDSKRRNIVSNSNPKEDSEWRSSPAHTRNPRVHPHYLDRNVPMLRHLPSTGGFGAFSSEIPALDKPRLSFRRSVERETLKSSDHRASQHEIKRQKDEDEEEEEDEEDEEDEEAAWEKACGGEGEGHEAGPAGRRLGGGSLHGLGSSRVHVAETVVTLRLQDVNDNSPVFPNATMFGQVQENGPIDLSVAVVAAWDADDTSEGTNAKVTYLIQKNAMHERTGDPIFSLHPETGLVRTAVCCLDRETTPEYQIQVVATDGGGLQGTGQVVVRLVDVNDNSPRLQQRLWEVELNETWGSGPPEDTSLLEISVLDPDTSNYFFYRVVESSGWGWQHFGLRTEGTSGHLHALQTLDYEDETHRRGFKFMVQVTDRGRGGWRDPRHLDSAWVSVRLRDVNDNPPLFHRRHAHVTVREDAAPGTLLAALPARDPDMGGKQEVDYRVEGGWGALTVDAAGGVSLRDSLDREGPGGTIGVAKILGVDRGQPPLTATATLTITLTDINDTPPFLLPPTLFHVIEGAAPTRLGTLTATDQDVWALGHGPPFTLSLAPTNPAHVLAHVTLKFDPHLDSGRGGAELWTAAAVDREEHPELQVAVRVADAGGLAATHTITVIIDDINDNPMKPASKTVYLWKTQGGGSEAPLGRVFVEDPDDWDLADKTFQWLGPPHPFFSLNAHTGDLLASSQVREGRYELHFAVSDQLWGQMGVAANVTVAVRLLDPDALAHAAHIIFTPTTPERLARGWTPQAGGGGLGRIMEGVSQVVGGAVHEVEVISVQSHPRIPADDATTPPQQRHHTPSASVWVTVRDGRGRFMDPVKLQGLLALHASQLETATNLTVLTEALPEGEEKRLQRPPHRLDLPVPLPNSHPDPSSAASTTLPLQVVDTNVTSLVTPRLTRALKCHDHEPQTCTPSSCLNGGRCVGPNTEKRCVCPGGTWGWSCKVLGRSFSGDGWAWVRPLPPCLPITISLRILTRRPHALVLYIGPLAPLPRQPHDDPTPMLAVQLWRGRPQLLVEGGAVPVKLEVPTRVNDGDWHHLHVRLNPQGVAATVDLCGLGWTNSSLDDSHCAARASWSSARRLEAWMATWPMQVGGMAHLAPSHVHHGWKEAPSPRPLDGCVSHLAFNGQLVDLGEPAYSKGSHKGCSPQQEVCPRQCGHRGRCVGGFHHPKCECDPGWTGPQCDTPTIPATLGPSSYARLALSFTPEPHVAKAQVRLRTRNVVNFPLLHLSIVQPPGSFTLHLRAGVACVTVSGAGWAARTACVEGYPLMDGAWHVVAAECHGHNLVITVDDGDGWRRNDSLVTLEAADGSPEPPVPLEIDASQGAMVGVWQEPADTSQGEAQDDFHRLCVDDLRVSGHPVPLPPTVNTTTWGQVASWGGLDSGCSAPDACVNSTCVAPLTCISTMGVAACRCGAGRRLTGGACEDVDECLWQPCLSGGTCYNLRPGFLCVCGPGHSGENCQWTEPAAAGHHLAAALALAFLTLSLLLLVVVGVGVSLRLRRCRLCRGGDGGGQREDGGGGTVLEEKTAAMEGEADWDAGSQAFLDCLKVQVPHTPSSPQLSGAAPAASHAPAKGRDLLPAQDDLRAYAYEGDGSSAGSLSSALSGLREEQADEGDKSIAPGFLEVMDLLRNLPEAIRSPLLLSKVPITTTFTTTISTIITTATTITTTTATTNTLGQSGSKVTPEEQPLEQKPSNKSLPQQEGVGAVYTIAGRTAVRGVTHSPGQKGASPLRRRDEKKTVC